MCLKEQSFVFWLHSHERVVHPGWVSWWTLAYSINDSYVTCCCAAFVSVLLSKGSSVSVPLSLFYFRFGPIYNFNTIYAVYVVSWDNIQFLSLMCFPKYPIPSWLYKYTYQLPSDSSVQISLMNARYNDLYLHSKHRCCTQMTKVHHF